MPGVELGIFLFVPMDAYSVCRMHGAREECILEITRDFDLL
jgi:hypothetical protein